VVDRSRDVQRRLSLLMDVWNDIVSAWESGKRVTRADVVRMLREAYGKERISPLRGASVPEDIYEKELASLYVVGKYGMGLEEVYPQLFDEVFGDEVRYEKAIAALLTEPPETARAKVQALLGRLDDNVIARMLRLKFTEVYFGFADEESLVKLIKALVAALPEKERIAVKYARFYIAFKIASAIARGEVRDRITKEALKQASALAFDGLQGVIPDDNYIAKIASEVFGVRPHRLRGILKTGPRERRPRAARPQD